MADQALSLSRICSKCGIEKPLTCYATTRTVDGLRLKRAHCRECYNVLRREHYARPAVHAQKRAKANAYNARPHVAQWRKTFRALAETKFKDKLARDKYRSNPAIAERLKRQKEEHRARPEIKAQTLYAACKFRSKRRGLPFDLTEQWVRSKVVFGKCEITGLAFDYGKAPNGWRYNPRSPSIDQIHAGRGYTMDNSRVVLTALNNALSQYGDDHFAQLALAFLRSRGFLITAP